MKTDLSDAPKTLEESRASTRKKLNMKRLHEAHRHAEATGQIRKISASNKQG